ncbi:MAG: metallophosphoesterase family protein [Bacteroidales bacterium]|nr:metallophosphoesterase family protein [Bacteroidales bacterium]
MKFAIISDIHSDFKSLEKAFREIRKSGYDHFVCLGDIVGYSYHYHKYLDGRDPDACIELVKEYCDISIAGNHDLYWSERLCDYFISAGIPGNWYDLDLTQRLEISEGRFWLYDDEENHPVMEENIKYLRSLPETKIFPCKKFSILFTHFLYPDLTGSTRWFPEEDKDFMPHLKYMNSCKCILGIMGHGHLQGYSVTSGKKLIYNYFGEYQLGKYPQAIIIPAITRGDSLNGYFMLDSDSMKLEAIKLD